MCDIIHNILMIIIITTIQTNPIQNLSRISMIKQFNSFITQFELIMITLKILEYLQWINPMVREYDRIKQQMFGKRDWKKSF